MDGSGGCWDDYETSEPVDHSRKFPTFSTSMELPWENDDDFGLGFCLNETVGPQE